MPRRTRRPNIAALVLSALIVFGGAAAVLHWQPRIPGLGAGRDGASSSAGVVREAAPPPAIGCREDARVAQGGVRFLGHCAGQAASFDGRYLVVKNAGRLAGVGLVRARDGASIDDLGVLDDGRGFTLFWSPGEQRFFANHQVDRDVDRFRLFDARGGRIVADEMLAQAAMAVLQARRPCLTPADVTVSGVRWSRDGARIALLAYARHAGCNGSGGWRPLWMIGEVESGRIDPASVRSRPGRAPLPHDGPYATL